MEYKSKLCLHHIMVYINNILACILPEEFSFNVYCDHTHIPHTHTHIPHTHTNTHTTHTHMYVYIYIYSYTGRDQFIRHA